MASGPALAKEKSLIILIQSAIEEYKTETSFGISSLWKHGNEGLKKADRLLSIISLPEVWNSGKLVWPILYAIYQTGGEGFKTIITRNIIYSGIMGSPKFYQLTKKIRGEISDELSIQTRAIQETIIENMKRFIGSEDDRIKMIISYLKGEIDSDKISKIINDIIGDTNAQK